MESNTGILQDYEPSISMSYMDFEPYCAWHKEEGCDTLAIHLHGFKKEQMRLQVNSQRMLTMHGQRPLDETKWSRFTKQIKLPEDCFEDRIRAKFAAGILTITMPKRGSSSSTAHEIERSSTKSDEPKLEDKESTKNNDNVIKKQQAVRDDERKKSVSEMLNIAGKVAAVILLLVVSGAYVNCMCKHRSSDPKTNFS